MRQVAAVGAVLWLGAGRLAAAPVHAYDLPAEPAARALEQFTAQSGEDLLYSADAVAGVVTPAVRGTFTPEQALERLLAGTGLRALRASHSKAIAIVRAPHPAPPPPRRRPAGLLRSLAALFARRRAAPDDTAPAAGADAAGATVSLPTFTVSANPTDRYRATSSSALTRVSGSPMDIPGSISVLTPEFITDINPTRIFDATKYLAGVSEGQGDAFYDRQYIRGFQDNRPTVDNFASIETNNIEPLFIDHVEVVKGPSAILAPSGTPGGQINVITKVPLFTARRAVSAEVGRIDSQKLSADLTGPVSAHGALAYRLLLGTQDGPLNTGGTRDRSTALGAALTYRAGNHTRLTVRGTYENRWVFVYLPAIFDPVAAVGGGDAVPGPGFALSGSRNGTESWAHRGGRFYTADFLLTASPSRHVNARIAGKYQRMIQRDRDEFALVPADPANRHDPYTGVETPNETWAPDPASGRYVPTYAPYYDPTHLIRHPVRQDGDAQDYQLQADLVANYGHGPLASTTVAGVVLDHQAGAVELRTAPDRPVNLFAPEASGPEPVWGPVVYQTHGSVDSDEEYLNEQLGLWDRRFTVMAGVVRAGSRSRYGGVGHAASAHAVPQYGVVWKPVPFLSLYASRSENAVAGYPNGTLLWQDGRQLEIGAKAEFLDHRLMVSAAHYHIAQANLPVANPAFQQDMTQPRELISDVGEHGTEFELMGALTRHISAVGSLSFLHQRDSLGRPVLMVPDRTWALLLNFRFTAGVLQHLTLTIGTTATSRRAGENPLPAFTVLGVPTQPAYFLPAVRLWSAGARYRWSARVSSALNIDNFFDRRYVALSSGRYLGGIGRPRNIRLTTTVHF